MVSVVIPEPARRETLLYNGTTSSSDDSIATARVPKKQVARILAHRLTQIHGAPVEEYLVEWHTIQPVVRSPYSWHPVEELRECSSKLQTYVEGLSTTSPPSGVEQGVKRKSPDVGPDVINLESNLDALAAREYNTSLRVEDGYYSAHPTSSKSADAVPWDQIFAHASYIGDRLPQARLHIRAEFERRLAQASTPKSRLTLTNQVDSTVPSLNFKFITKYRYGTGVTQLELGTVVGCGASYEWSNQKCSPSMGQGIGCEYSRVCDCMEYADIDTKRLKDEEKRWMKKNPGETRLDLPKRFPYSTSGAQQGCLVPFYLNSRSPIYECNDQCACGRGCRNRQVQWGRQKPLEIFRTSNGRGWGLRCGVDLRAGEFIDTYRGEIITSEEADRRESDSQKSASYLFSLDKFAGEDSGLALEDCYVVDGEYAGGPTRFINHSCSPNTQQHTVSLNKFDRKVYLLAFFANEYIPRGTELTFDYMDKDGKVDMPANAEDLQPCLCSSSECRGSLWI